MRICGFMCSLLILIMQHCRLHAGVRALLIISFWLSYLFNFKGKMFAVSWLGWPWGHFLPLGLVYEQISMFVGVSVCIRNLFCLIMPGDRYCHVFYWVEFCETWARYMYNDWIFSNILGKSVGSIIMHNIPHMPALTTCTWLSYRYVDILRNRSTSHLKLVSNIRVDVDVMDSDVWI